MDATLQRLRPKVLRFRNARTVRDRLQRQLAVAEVEYQAARQELELELDAATGEIR